MMGLSPIIGAFVVGMAVASTHLIKRIESYTEKLGMIFAPLFFAIIGVIGSTKLILLHSDLAFSKKSR
jgi:Kef-type K+ transport system membrane component KefB